MAKVVPNNQPQMVMVPAGQQMMMVPAGQQPMVMMQPGMQQQPMMMQQGMQQQQVMMVPAGQQPMVQPMMVQQVQQAPVQQAELHGVAAVAAILEPHKSIHIEQRIRWLEMCGCEMENSYAIKGHNGELIMNAEENSACCDRLCLKPFQSALVYLKEPNGKVLLTLERRGMHGWPCCCCNDSQLLGCFACTDGCTDSMYAYEGYIDYSGSTGYQTKAARGSSGGRDAKKIESISGAPSPMLMVRAPVGGGGITPTLEVTRGGEMKGVIEGPTCFGGWSELCCDSTFYYSSGPGKSGNLAEIKHLAPTDCCELWKACATDSDNFRIDIKGDIDASDKVALLTGTILVDYMFFEIDEGLCHDDGQNVKCTLFLCFCYGCLCPCNINLPKNKGG